MVEELRLLSVAEVFDTLTFSRGSLDNVGELVDLMDVVSERRLFATDFGRSKQRSLDETRVLPEWLAHSPHCLAQWVVAVFESRLVRAFVANDVPLDAVAALLEGSLAA